MAAVITISSDVPFVDNTVTVIEIDYAEGVYGLTCDGQAQCLRDLEIGDTWSSLIDCIQDGVTHIGNHEPRS